MDLRHTHRIFVSRPLALGDSPSLTADQTHHLLHVLRLKAGDVVRLFNGHHGEFCATITSTGKRDISLSVDRQLRSQESEGDLWLCCAPIKKAHFEYMIEKATELGVSEIQPVLTARTQIREVNADRVYHICREAAEQSDRLDVPAVGLPVSLTDLIEVFPMDRAMIVCAEWGDALSVKETFDLPTMKTFTKAAIVTGPEGGFDATELDALRTRPGVFFVRLGSRILRADTAALTALAFWQAFQGKWNSSA